MGVSIPLPANITKQDLIENILKHAKEVGRLLSVLESVRSEPKPVRTKKDKSTPEDPTKKKRGRKPKAQAGAEPSKETKTMSKELESELSVLELYKKRYAKEPTPALERIIKRQEERVMKARAK